MQIADSAFACWCLTFPLEVAHRLNYAPYLQSVCKHLLSSHTPPPSANPTSAHLILGASVWMQLGRDGDSRSGGGGGDDKWWGSWKCITACRFITTVLKTFSTKTVQDKIISISAGEEAFSSIHSLSWQLRDLLRSFQLHSIIWAQLELLIQCFIISVTAIRMILILLCKLHFSQITAVFQLPEEMCFYLVALKQETVEIMNTLENSSLF